MSPEARELTAKEIKEAKEAEQARKAEMIRNKVARATASIVRSVQAVCGNESYIGDNAFIVQTAGNSKEGDPKIEIRRNEGWIAITNTCSPSPNRALVLYRFQNGWDLTAHTVLCGINVAELKIISKVLKGFAETQKMSKAV